jgi:hypothetical protein
MARAGWILRGTNGAPLDDLDPKRAILRVVFGPIGLRNGELPIYGRISNWNRSQWPMPDFVRCAEGVKPILVRYSDDDPSRLETEFPIDDDTGLETDATSGYGSVEITLTKLLR